jgi:glycosyltransferase involved in cell wall biosynthesis
LVVDGVNGFRLREGSSAELEKHLVELLDDPSLRAAMAASSSEMIRGKFSFSKFVDRVVGVIDGV